MTSSPGPGTASNGEDPIPEPSVGLRLFVALVVLGLGAAGVGAISTYREKAAQSADLEERGVRADADVMSVTEVSGRRIEPYAKLRVSYDPPGPKILEFAEVQDCPGARWEGGISTVRVVYLPDAPQVIRLEACQSSFDANILPGILGVVFIVLALFMAWRTRHVWVR